MKMKNEKKSLNKNKNHQFAKCFKNLKTKSPMIIYELHNIYNTSNYFLKVHMFHMFDEIKLIIGMVICNFIFFFLGVLELACSMSSTLAMKIVIVTHLSCLVIVLNFFTMNW
jgi:hypothetical protein